MIGHLKRLVEQVRDAPRHKVTIGSVELTAYHEAGHIEAALACGARVVAVELYREPRPVNAGWRPTAHTELKPPQRGEDLRRIMAAGVAAEWRLWRAGRLISTDGRVPDKGKFIEYALECAKLDLVAFSKVMPDGGCLPVDPDEEFIGAAIDHAEHRMKFTVVDRIARALLARGKLDQVELGRIASGQWRVPTGERVRGVEPRTTRHPLNLKVWKECLSSHTFHGRELLRVRLEITAELRQILDHFGWPPGSVYAVRDGRVEAVWIDRRHNYCAIRKSGDEIVIATVSGVPWWERGHQLIMRPFASRRSR